VADLGWHRLKDIAEAEHLYQLLIAGLPDTFPPLKSLGNRGSLPKPPTPFMARSGTARCAGAACRRGRRSPGHGDLSGGEDPAGSGRRRITPSGSDGVFFAARAGDWGW
jgi:hypothetical protein